MTLPKLPFPPEQATYVYSSDHDVVSTSLDGGLSRSRRDIVGSAAMIEVSWVLDLDDYQYFKAFYNSSCNRGASPFLIDLLLDQPYLEEYTAKFMANTLKMSEPFGLMRKVSAQLEVIPVEDLAMDEIVVILRDIFGDCEPNSILSLLAKLVNVDLVEDESLDALAQLVNVDLEQSSIEAVSLALGTYDWIEPLEQLVNEDLEVV